MKMFNENIRNTISITIISIIFLVIPIFVYAISGACSSHGGVNCSIGWQLDGRVYCNDGWTESIAYYEYMKKCENYNYCWYLKTYHANEYNALLEKYDIINTLNQINNIEMQYTNKEAEWNKKLAYNRNETVDMRVIEGNEASMLRQKALELNNLINQLKIAQNFYDRSMSSVNLECDSLAREQVLQQQLDFLKNQIENTCPVDSILVGDNCVCKQGYLISNNKCVTYTEDCRNSYGENVYGVKNNNKNNSICYCLKNYEWNNNKTACVESGTVKGVSSLISDSDSNEKIIDEEKNLITKIDNNLSKRVSGNILLQVESKGEGWYVNPDNKKKYYLGRPADAFSIMKNLGLGIKRGELANYLNTKFPSRLSGKIVLDVEQNGEAYYINPKDLKGYFLNRPADAFRVMRDLGLGITNNDIRKIDVGEIK